MAAHFSLRLPTETAHEVRRRLRSDDGEYGDNYGLGHALLVDDASLACVMFLESEVESSVGSSAESEVAVDDTPPSASSRLFAAALGALVRNCQPPPRMLHAELLLVSATGECYHFATYVGDEARWRDRGAEYYRAHRWRALPIDGGDGVRRLASQCHAEVGAAYSLARYALSTSLLGWAAGAARQRTRDPAHCGGLSARIVQHALGARGAALLPRASTRYSPSDLYNDLCAHSYAADFDGSVAMLQDEELLAAADLLLTGTDAQVRQLGARRRAVALKTLALRTHAVLADVRTSSEAQRTHHARALGWAATRVADCFGDGGARDGQDGQDAQDGQGGQDGAVEAR